MKLPNKTLERKLFKNGYGGVIGIDEVGMGCLAGPVVVCAASFNQEFFKKPHSELNGVRDSKLLSASQRETLAKQLINTSDLKFRIASVHTKTIDKVNIYQAARMAMRRAVAEHSSKSAIVLVDGKTKIPGLDMEQVAIVKGDRKVFAIACASIIAKVHRDRMMMKYAKKYPQYGFERHKGYGTQLHQARLAQFGPCEIHRKSFAPVAKLL